MVADETSSRQGYVHVYTGDGKGKTSAALGLALRAAGAGLRVFFAQFVKGRPSSEHKALERFSDLITLRQYGRGCFVRHEPSPEDIEAARRGLAEVREIINEGRYQVVVLDEANVATHLKLFPVESLLEIVERRPAGVELVITGRCADPRLIERADLVTEMKSIKHYHAEGVRARLGIEE